MTEPYVLAGCIVLPHIRFIDHISTSRFTVWKAFHTEPCDKVDEEGFCKGHVMTRLEFMDKYCKDVQLKVMGSAYSREIAELRRVECLQ